MKIDNNTLAILLVVVLVVLLFGGFGFGMMSFGGGMMNGYYNFGWIFNVLILILIIAGAYWLVKKMNGNKRR